MVIALLLQMTLGLGTLILEWCILLSQLSLASYICTLYAKIRKPEHVIVA